MCTLGSGFTKLAVATGVNSQVVNPACLIAIDSRLVNFMVVSLLATKIKCFGCHTIYCEGSLLCTMFVL